MTRFLPVLAVLAASAATLVGGPVQAQSGAFYVAKPAEPPAKPTMVTRSTLWRLQNGAYVAAQASERHTIVCQLVAKNVGRLESFSVAGTAYTAEALDKCNAKAKQGGGAAMAAAAR
jgi:hypothetical protein